MSDFLLVVPSGWMEYESVNDLINTGVVPPDLLMSNIAQEAWGDIDVMLLNASLLPDGFATAQARLIQTDSGYRFWVRYS
jgi:hypothetical protein